MGVVPILRKRQFNKIVKADPVLFSLHLQKLAFTETLQKARISSGAGSLNGVSGIRLNH